MKNGGGANSPHVTRHISNPSKTRKGIEVTHKLKQKLTRKHTPIKELTDLLKDSKTPKIKLTLRNNKNPENSVEFKQTTPTNLKYKQGIIEEKDIHTIPFNIAKNINRLEAKKAPQLQSQKTKKEQIEKLGSLSIQDDQSELRFRAIISKDSNDESSPGRIETNQTLKKNSSGNFSNNIGNRTGKPRIFFTYSNPQSV
jgi:hypothetical protein